MSHDLSGLPQFEPCIECGDPGTLECGAAVNEGEPTGLTECGAPICEGCATVAFVRQRRIGDRSVREPVHFCPEHRWPR